MNLSKLSVITARDLIELPGQNPKHGFTEYVNFSYMLVERISTVSGQGQNYEITYSTKLIQKNWKWFFNCYDAYPASPCSDDINKFLNQEYIKFQKRVWK